MIGAFVLCGILCFLGVSSSPQTPEQPRNIILVIGDGMGLAHIALAEYLTRPPSVLQRMEVIGLQKTHSYSHLETDSGAAGTAISCGIKTYNGAIGLTHDSISAATILELAKEKGMATGLVVTSSIVHATPASFYAHVTSRGSYEEIAKALVGADIDVFVGGGEKYFIERYSDKLNLVEILKRSNYEIVRSYSPAGRFRFEGIHRDKRIACFTAYEDPTRASVGRTYLTKAVKSAIRALEARSDKGYFLMVEASQIDWAAHANDENWLAFEMQDAYDMMDQVLEHVNETDDTLLIITADHECGYMSLKGRRSPRVEFNSKFHSSQMVPVFAHGPGADAFAGIYDNTAIFWKMRTLLGL